MSTSLLYESCRGNRRASRLANSHRPSHLGPLGLRRPLGLSLLTQETLTTGPPVMMERDDEPSDEP